jgi:RNA polymerase primary sigma factor
MNCTRMKNGGSANSLQLYLREIRDESLLTAAEECALAVAIAQGDKDARTRMIQANLRLVVKIARDYMGRGMVLDDLIGEGNLGLIRATEEFEPRFGTRFSTYASYWIKQSIRHALINTTSTIRLPAHMVCLLTKWGRAERALCRDMDHAPSFNEVASTLGLTETQKSLVAKARQARQLKLEGSIALETGRRSALGTSGQCAPPDASLEADDEWRILLHRMERLDTRERTILTLRFGLEGELPVTLKEIGGRLGLTREWVRKIELRAVRMLDDKHDESRAAGRFRSDPDRIARRAKSARPAQVATPGASPAPNGVQPRPRVRRHSLPRAIRRTEQSSQTLASAF